jgi:uncharacterized protein (DUF302 family)
LTQEYQPKNLARASGHPIRKEDRMDNGIVNTASPHSVDETLKRLETLLEAKGINIFARIDHSGEAAKVGMEMHPTKLLIFGSPKGGTPVMLAAPTSALDLPLKALVWEDDHGKVWISSNDPAYLQKRHGIPPDLIKNLAGPGALIQKAVE